MDTASVCVRNDFLISDEEDMVAAAVMLMGVYILHGSLVALAAPMAPGVRSELGGWLRAPVVLGCAAGAR
jgi:hypothetical protein